MTMLRHGDFITKMAFYEKAGIWESYRKRHASDPQVPALIEETHDAVCKLGAVIELSSLSAMRNDLILRFRANPNQGPLPYKRTVRRSTLIKAMKASGLKWFELDGNPLIHWSEKP